MIENMSEVARLRQQIALEYEAAERALHAPAMVGRHDFITARQAAAARMILVLGSLVGDEGMRQMIEEL